MVGKPWRLHVQGEPILHHAPLLGEANDYVLGDLLGLSSADIADLANRQVTY
jgi:hypothetical protein